MDKNYVLGLLELLSVQSQYTVAPKRLDCFLLHNLVILTKGYRFLWGSQGKRLTIHFWQYIISESFLMRPSLPFIQESKLAQV